MKGRCILRLTIPETATVFDKEYFFLSCVIFETYRAIFSGRIDRKSNYYQNLLTLDEAETWIKECFLMRQQTRCSNCQNICIMDKIHPCLMMPL